MRDQSEALDPLLPCQGVDVATWDDAWNAPWDALADQHLLPGSPFAADLWRLPKAWASGGTRRRPSLLVIDFARALPEGWHRDEARSENALRRLKRIAALMMVKVLPINGRRMNPNAPSTWAESVRDLVKAAHGALALLEISPDGPGPEDGEFAIFARLTPSEMQTIRDANVSFGATVIARLNALLATEAFDDWPAIDVAPQRIESQPIEPLPDAFSAAVLSAAVWLVEDLGPDLLACWASMKASKGIAESASRSWTTQRRFWREFLSDWQGERLKPGYQLRYRAIVRASSSDNPEISSWPPEDPASVRQLLALLQTAHSIVIAFSTAARDADLAEMPRDCLIENEGQDLLRGFTFKTSERPGGEYRDWPLPRLTVAVVKQQQRLAQLVGPRGKKLFVSFAGEHFAEEHREGVNSLAGLFRTFGQNIFLSDGTPLASLCDKKLSSMRIRKTVVRLAALSLVGANQILFDVLGHREPEMTLGYILSDPNIQDDVRTIAHEASIALAKEAIVHAETNGGPAAKAVDDLAGRHQPRGAPPALEAAGLRKAAEILSLGGTITLVRRNVLCTKSVSQYGPCTRRAGKPDAGNCQPDCAHRLEMDAARADHLAAIGQILDEMPAEEGMMRSWWQGQLVTHLLPFAEVRAQVALDERLAPALQGLSDRTLTSLDLKPDRSPAFMTEASS